jgi:hypothetical protein
MTNHPQVLSQVFTIITQFAGFSSIVLAIICKDLVKYAYHLHPSFDDLWLIRCSERELTPMKVLSFLEWGPWGIGTYVSWSDNVIFSLRFLDVVFDVEFSFCYDRKFILVVTCPNFVNNNNNDSEEDTEPDDEYQNMVASTPMLIPLTVPKHEIRKTLLPCFQTLYSRVKKHCLSFLNKNPQCLVSKNIQDSPVVRKMNADSWLKVAERWINFEKMKVDYWEENPKDVFYYK